MTAEMEVSQKEAKTVLKILLAKTHTLSITAAKAKKEPIILPSLRADRLIS